MELDAEVCRRGAFKLESERSDDLSVGDIGNSRLPVLELLLIPPMSLDEWAPSHRTPRTLRMSPYIHFGVKCRRVQRRDPKA